MTLDQETVNELKNTGEFATMRIDDDEAEHSLEMHLPYIYKMLSSQFQPANMPPIVPILVGSTSASTEKKFGAILAPYLEDPANIFVISSDFCHWGTRFRYTYYKPSVGPPKNLRGNDASPNMPHIHESISIVDRLCWQAVETGKHDAFLDILEETGNTVCGRHPIGVMMAAVEEWRNKGEARASHGTFRFVRYERSSLVQVPSDSSVSYCSAYAVF